MTTTPTLSADWNVTSEQIGAHNDRTLIIARHTDADVFAIIKEHPNGVDLQHRESANLPGGFKTHRTDTFASVSDAVSALERCTVTFDSTEEWPVKNSGDRQLNA